MNLFKKNKTSNEIAEDELNMIQKEQEKLYLKYIDKFDYNEYPKEKDYLNGNTNKKYYTLYYVLNSKTNEKFNFSSDNIITIINDIDVLVMNNINYYMEQLNKDAINNKVCNSDLIVCQMIYTHQLNLLLELKKMLYFNQNDNKVRNRTSKIILEIISWTEASLECMNETENSHYSWRKYVEGQMTTFQFLGQRIKELLNNHNKNFTYIDETDLDKVEKAEKLVTSKEKLFNYIQKEINF